MRKILLITGAARAGRARVILCPEDNTEAALYLLSDQASYVAGAVLDVTGGR